MIADIILKVAGMDKQERGKYRPRPSLSGPERCIRQLTYWANGTPEDKAMADRFLLVLDDSSWHETLTTDWINKTAYKFHSSQLAVDIPAVSFVEDIDFLPAYTCEVCGAFVLAGHLHGHIDGIITDLLLDEFLFEHKALNHFTFNRYATGETFPLDHIAQSCLYVRGVQGLNPLINKALLLIKNKNTAQYLEMVIHYDRKSDTATVHEITISTGEKIKKETGSLLIVENIVGDAFRKLSAVHDHAKKKTLPVRPYEYGTEFPCGYCSWEETCWKNYEQEVEAIAKNEADLSELADAARFHKELGAQIYTMKAQQDEVSKSIKAKLKELNARHGKAGEYEVALSLTKRKGYTVEDCMFEQLRITKFKVKEKKK